MARAPWTPQLKAGRLLSLLGAGEASCVIRLSSVERPLRGSAVLFSKVSVGRACLLLPRGLSLLLLAGCVMSEGDCVWRGTEGHHLCACRRAQPRADPIPSPDPKTTHGFLFSAEEAGVSGMFLEPCLQGQEVLMLPHSTAEGSDSERSEKPVLDPAPSLEHISQLASLTPLHVPQVPHSNPRDLHFLGHTEPPGVDCLSVLRKDLEFLQNPLFWAVRFFVLPGS